MRAKFYLNIKDVSKVLCVSGITAHRRIQLVKVRYQVGKYKPISMLQLCQTFDIELNKAYERLLS